MKQIKQLIPAKLKRPLYIAYFDLLRKLCEPFGVGRYSKVALNDLDTKLTPYLSKRGGYFIEVGGNDGISQSNTYYLEKILGWKGVLIEPIPSLYKKCRQRRLSSRVFNYALVSNSYTGKSIKMHYAHLMSVVDGALKSDQATQDQIKSGMRLQGLDETYQIEVPTKTLTEVLAEAGAPEKIDFFSLDVEGYERQVLEGLDLVRYRPEYILIEARFFDEVNQLIIKYYRVIARPTEMDVLYQRIPGK
jgi:FkbM family methyltransferase